MAPAGQLRLSAGARARLLAALPDDRQGMLHLVPVGA